MDLFKSQEKCTVIILSLGQTKGVDHAQVLQNSASDQGLHCLLFIKQF